jgi:hypothetical protein
MLPARISKKNMAVERLNHSLNDSLEIGRAQVNGGSRFSPSRSTPPVAPVEMGEKADFRAFSAQEDELAGGSLCPDLLPYDDLLLLQDKTNGKNRALGVERLQAAVESVASSTVLEENLPSLVDEACSAMGDSHIKVCLAGLQLLDPLIRRTGSNLSPHVSSLVEAVLVKMGRNKHVLKKTGMRILVHLMHYSQPQDVLTEITRFGLRHKQSKVREESLNVLTAALIRFPRSEFRLTQLARDVVSLLSDEKPHVRQACMECMAKITSLCNSEEDLRQVMSFAAKNGHHPPNAPHSLAALKALECRIVRECGPPRLREDGLVEYGMPVVGVDVPLSQHGPDVEWIRSGALGGEENSVSNGLEESSVARKEARLRPFRSASKKLPWEIDEAERSKNGDITNGHLNDTTADLNTTFTLPKASKNAAPSRLMMHQRPPSSKQLFAKEGSRSPPSHRPPTGRRQLAPLSDSEKRRSPPRSPVNSSETSLFLQDPRDMVPPPSRGGPLPPPIPPPGTKFSRRHQSLPSGVANRDLPTRGQQHKTINFGNGSPRLGPIGSPASSRHNQQHVSDEAQSGGSGVLPPAVPPSELVESWPRSRVRARGKRPAVTGAPAGPSELITADPLKAVGGVGDPVRTSIVRPPSKPRAHNPIIMKQRQEDKKLKTSLLQQHQQQESSQENSPTQTEKEFLMCANTTLQDDYYYSSVPEDTTGLEHSLSSSLTSLCRHPREPAQSTRTTEVEKLEQVRKEQGSRKAPHHSAVCSQSYSPQAEIPVGLSHKQRQKKREEAAVADEAAEKRARTGVRVEKDFNRTFTLGVSLAHADPSSVSWQTLQALTQAAPVPPPPEIPTKTKKKKKKKRSNEGSGSSEGSDPTLHNGERGARKHVADTEYGQNQRTCERNEPLPSHHNGRKTKPNEDKRGLATVKTGLRKVGALGPEGQRPSIERGGTNTIKMEVNGVKSPPPPAQLSPEKELSPPAAVPPARGGARGAAGRKQRQSEPAFMFGSHETKMGMGGQDDSPTGTTRGGATLTDESRKKHSKYAVIGGTKGTREDHHLAQSNGHHHRRRGSCDDGFPVTTTGENGSPMNRSLPDLQPFSSPERGLREALSQLDDSDWNKKCDGLLGIRRLAAFHTQRLIPDLHDVTLAVVKEVENLRSSVSRAAISCLGDVFVYAGDYMDPELDRVVKVLMHKTGESNAFLREDVEKTMDEIAQHATPGKLLLAIVAGGFNHRNSQVRRTAAQFLSQAVERYGPAQLLHASKDLEKTLVAALSFVGDATADPRFYGRVCLSHLMTEPDFERIASRTLNTQQWSKMRDAVEMIRVKGVGDPPSEATPTTRSRHPTGGTSRATSHAKGTGGPRTSVAVHCGENPPLPDRLVEQLNANNWEDRQEAINVLEQFVDRHPKALEPHMHKVFDAFNPRLTDRNSKVNLRALQAFSNMVPLLGSVLAPLSPNIIKALMPNLASKNSSILSAATIVFDLVSQCIGESIVS